MVRAAMTQTVNAYKPMPSTVAELQGLKGKLDDIRRANVDHHVELMAAAQAQGVQVICFGELFPGPYFAMGKDPMWFALAENAESGPTVTALKEAARHYGQVVVAPIYEQDPSGGRFNTAVVIDEKGVVLGKYRKTHIPFGTNEQGSFDEPFYYDRSDGKNGRTPANISKNDFFPVFKTSFGNLGVAICYDRHFEGVMHSLAREGAELVMSPAVTFGNKSHRMWHLEFQVDAARHRLFIGGSNRKGSEPPWNQPYFGDTHFAGPNGVAQNISKHENLVISDVDLAELSGPDPSGWNLPRDIRYSIYSGR
jgi:N-carbamoylputrescine amidase